MNTMPDQPSQWIFRVPHSMSVACSSEVAHSTHYDQQLQLIQAKIPPVIQFSAGSTPGTFMWDQQRHELCVRPCEVQGLVNEALEMARKEGLSNISFLEDELQVPHFYEDSQTFANQFLYNLVEVDMKQLSFVHQKLWESQGHCMPPIELVQKGEASPQIPQVHNAQLWCKPSLAKVPIPALIIILILLLWLQPSAAAAVPIQVLIPAAAAIPLISTSDRHNTFTLIPPIAELGGGNQSSSELRAKFFCPDAPALKAALHVSVVNYGCSQPQYLNPSSDHAVQQPAMFNAGSFGPPIARIAADFVGVGYTFSRILSLPSGQVTAINLATGATMVGLNRSPMSSIPWVIYALTAVTLHLPMESTMGLADWCCFLGVLTLIAAVTWMSQSVGMWAAMIIALDMVGDKGLWPLVAIAYAMERVGGVAGWRNLRADSRAKTALAHIMVAWICWCARGLRVALIVCTALSAYQAGSVAHMVWTVGRCIGVEMWRHTPSMVRVMVVAVAVTIVWVRFCNANTQAVLRLVAEGMGTRTRLSRFKRNAGRHFWTKTEAPSHHNLRRRAERSRSRARAKARAPRMRGRARGWHATTAESYSAQPGSVDSAVPLGREDDIEAGHCLDEELGMVFGPAAGFEGEGAWTKEEYEDFRTMLTQNKGFMSTSATDLPGYSGEMGKFDIPFADEAKAHFQKPRRYSPAESTLIDEHFNKLLEADIIGKAPNYCENTCNPVVAMKKALDGSWTDRRVALDCRGINELSLRDRTPPRLPEDLFHDIGKDQYISKLDLRSGFHQILLTDDASRKTCFWWAREGAAPEQYVYKRMPFGCTNSTAMFCRVIEHELRGLRCAKVYCDDILITSPTARDHIKDVASVIERLSQVGLRGHPGKSVFAAAGCEFLGFLLRPGRLSPHQAKVAAIKELPTPTDVRGLRAVLGFMNFYRIMAARIGEDGYSTLAWPLNCLLRKGNENIKELWGEEHDKALAALKERLTEPGIVVHAYDPSRPLYLMTDWSGVGISAILGQKDDEGNEVIVAAVSRTLSRSEMRYSSFYGEALAVVYGVRSFRHYLHGVKFTLITDHKPLTWLQRSTTLTGMHLRWQVSLQEFEYDTVHRSGASHTNADVLSRYPRGSCADPTGASVDPPEVSPELATACTFACLCARYPRSHAMECVEDSVACATLQYERVIGGRPDDPCVAEDLVNHAMGEKWSQYLQVTDSSQEEEDGISLWEEVCGWFAQRQSDKGDCGMAAVVSKGAEDEGRVTALDTRPLPPGTVAGMAKEGAIVVELCAGLCSGLEAWLIAGGSMQAKGKG
ncbi:hypothetical protein CYMTET_8129 [Cymbomonas tetramitiformis]|uniref:Reverse transcriptase domain-containing protein n=1 Tax=Cymbomonas tetramitiformis TaxID=36881 RepID=A0AAE0LGS7_9CHLO|nr:hypothetical protein CYMTET_8129 [Cymbomonas tetramitiformis]